LPRRLAAAAFVSLLAISPSAAQQEIKLGQTMPYSGTGSAWGTIGRAHSAYFDMLNAKGGINGRKVKLVSLDDGYSPPKTVEQTRKLVEQERVVAIFGSLGTGGLVATKDYLIGRGVPQLFLSIGNNIWGPEADKIGTLFAPLRHTETDVYARYIAVKRPDAKIGILSQNDDFGRELVKAMKLSLKDNATKIVKEVTYEATDATVDSQIIALKTAGVDTFINFANPKFTIQAIRKASDIEWKPEHILFSFSALIDGVFKPAGLDKSAGIVTATYMKDPKDPLWANDQGVKDYLDFMKTYYPSGDPNDLMNSMGYTAGMMVTQALQRAGDDLSRDNIAKQAKSIPEMQLPMVLPGIKFSTRPDSVTGLHDMKLQRFDGARWALMD
jgi:ABC-type branched-subunit amino acid transport system substrate-binding protein